MAAVTTVVDGNIKFREGKKWKNRWCVLKKPSPVADHLQLVLYKDVSEACKPNAKAKAVYTVDSFFGLEAEICVDREQHVLAIICLKNVFLLAFELRESMIRFEIKIRQSLGEEHQFPVQVVKAPSSSKLPKDQLSLIIHDTRFCLTGQTPPKILMSWNVEDLRRYVARDDKFIFEAGARCGKGSGLFALQSEQSGDIADIINLASSGKMSNCHRKFKNRSSQIELGSHLISPLPSSQSSSSSSSSQPHHYYHHHHHHSQQLGQHQLQQDTTTSTAIAKAPLQMALPATLNCCHQNQTGSAESEDWSWYKRHSVSVTDHRRISALRDMNATVDNRDQVMMAASIYDTPPNHHAEQGAMANRNPEPTYDHPRSYLDQIIPTTLSSASIVLPPTSDYVNNDVEYTKIDFKEKGREDENIELKDAENTKTEKEKVESDSTSVKVVQSGLEAAAVCDETLERLKKQEYALQREMLLLDEMLQSCTAEDKSLEQGVADSRKIVDITKVIPVTQSDTPETLQPAKNITENCVDRKNVGASFGLYDELPLPPVSKDNQNSTLDSSSLNDIPTSPSLSYNNDFEIISGNVSIMKPDPMSRSGITVKKPKSISDRLNTSLPEGTPLSPLFQAKLNSIPQSSRLNAPLPYVNLSGYDDDGTNHVHLPGSAESLPTTVTRGGSFHGLNTSQGCGDVDKQTSPWKDHTRSSTSLHLPVAVSSLTNLNQHQFNLDNSPRRLHGRQSLDSATGRIRNNHVIDHFKLKQAIEGHSFSNALDNQSQKEVLVVKMNNSVTDNSRKYSCSSRSSSVQSLSYDANESMKSNKSDLVNLLTVDSGQQVLTGAKKEEVYVNLPVVKEDSPPPPPLPPKGPALLQKLKTTSVNLNKTKHTSAPTTSSMFPTPICHQQRPTNTILSPYQDRNYGYDNEPVLTSTQSRKKKDVVVEESNSNYLEMGSPKTNHKYSAKTVPKVGPRQLDMAPKQNKTLAKIPKGRDDYMDMGVVDLPQTSDNLKYDEDDEIYLDVDETFKHSDLYISEKGTGKSGGAEEYVPVSVLPDKKECTYIEMAQVGSRKSMVVQNLETLQAYVSQKLGKSEKALNTSQDVTNEKESANANSQAVTVVNHSASPSHPPLPRSFKIRHNSDSGPRRRASASLDSLSSSNNSSGNNNSGSCSKPGKSPMKVYTRMKGSSEPPLPPSPNTDRPVPFTNLMEFTKRMGDGKSTYVNTSVNSDDVLVAHEFVPLPEPVTKEGFLARLKRRGSRDKGTPEKSGQFNNNNSGASSSSVKYRSVGVLERSNSEHESPKCLRREDRSSSSAKLKIGRRRSSSFPNRLSYQESNTEPNGLVTESNPSTPTASSGSVSSESCQSKPVWKKDHSQSESSSSIHDNNSDASSDVSPLLKHGKSGVVNSITLLHVQQDGNNKQPFGKDLVYASPSKSSKSSLTSLSSSNSSTSKTDDEKMIEIYQRQQQPPNHYHRKSKSMPSDSAADTHYHNYQSYRNKTPDISIGVDSTSVDDRVYLNSSLEYSDTFSSTNRNDTITTCNKMVGTGIEDYCNMDTPPVPPPRPPNTLSVNVGVNTHGNGNPPALPPKTKNYQVLLSPVHEIAPSLPLERENISFCNTTDDDININTSSAMWKSERDVTVEEDSLSDQYVELKGADDDETREGEEEGPILSGLNSSCVNSKAGRESIPSTSSSSESKEVNPACAATEYTTISIPIGHHALTNGEVECRDEEEHQATATAVSSSASPRSSPVLVVPNSIVVQLNSIPSDDINNSEIINSCCVNPAKSVLRPRAGREYIVVKRIPASDTSSLVSASVSAPASAGLVSPSPSLSIVFDYDAHHNNNHHHHYCKSHQHHLNHHHNHHQHNNPPASSCTSLSVCSQRSRATTPQRSPSFTSTVGMAQSQSSLLLHEPWERVSSSVSNHPTVNFSSHTHNPHHHKSPPTAHNGSSSVTVLSYTPSPSPKFPSNSIFCKYAASSSPKTKKNNCLPCSSSALREEDTIFFPVDMRYNSNSSSISPLPLPARRSGMSGCSANSQQEPIYVNQQFVDMHNSQNQSPASSRTNSTCSSQCNSSPLRSSYLQTHRSLLQDSFPSTSSTSRQISDPNSNSLGRKSRMRSRHSESDVGFSGINRLSKSFTLPSNHHHHHRPSLTLPVINVHRSHSDPKKADHLQPRQSVSQSHIHRKEFDKFANSSIIARRRLQHPQSSRGNSRGGNGGGGEDSPPPVARRTLTSESSPNLQVPSSSNSVKSSGYKNIDRFNSTLSPASDYSLQGASSNSSSNNVSPACFRGGMEVLSQSHGLLPNPYPPPISHSPPPLPIRQRLVSSPSSTASPPLTPFATAYSDTSDSPPPYNAPPPPDFHRSDSYLSPSSSEELNYIEIDMSTRPPCPIEEPPLPLPLSFSRRSKRARQQRKLAKLRYAEIDHTATKALQHTGQEHAQTRRGGGGILSKSGSSLSRMNSAPLSKNHKPLAVRERKHSTGSVESF